MLAEVNPFACLSNEYKKVPPENSSASRIFTISPMSRNNPLANLFSEQNTHVPFSEQRAPKGEHNKLQTQDMKGNRKGREIACTAILCQPFPILFLGLGSVSLWLFFFASSSVLHCHGSKSLGFLTFIVPLFIPSRISSHSEVMPVALPTAASSGPLDMFFIRFFFKFILLQISSHFCRSIPAPDVTFYTSPMWHSQLRLF